MNSKKGVFLLLLFVLSISSVIAKDRIINKSTSKTYTDVQLAFDELKDNQELFFETGKYKGDTWFNTKYGYFVGYERLVLSNKNNIKLTGSGINSIVSYVLIENCDNIEINGIQFVGMWIHGGPNPTRLGEASLKITNSENTKVYNSYFSITGLKIEGGEGHIVARNVFTNNFNYNFYADVINIEVYHNTFNYFTYYYQTQPLGGFPRGGGFIVKTKYADDSYIKNNIIYKGKYGVEIDVNLTKGSNRFAGNMFTRYESTPKGSSNGSIDGWTVQDELNQNNSYVNENIISDDFIPLKYSIYIDSGVSIPGFNDPAQVSGLPDVGAKEYTHSQFVTAYNDKLLKSGNEILLKSIAFTNFYYFVDHARFVKESGGDNTITLLKANYHNKDSFQEIKDFGFNTIRFALNANWFLDKDDKLEVRAWLKENIKWAKEKEVYLILDMHMPPGLSWLNEKTTSKYDATDTGWIWKSEEKKNQLIDIWKEIAEIAKDSKWVAAYGMLNEPVTADDDGSQWWAKGTGLAHRIKEAIRSVDKNHMLIMDGLAGYGVYNEEKNKTYLSYVHEVKKHYILDDENVLYDFHFYEPGAFTHKGAHWAGEKDDGSKYDYKTMVSEEEIPDSFWSSNQGSTTPEEKIQGSTWKEYETSWYKVSSDETEFFIANVEVVDSKKKGLGNTKVYISDIVIEEKNGSSIKTLRDVKVNWGNVYGVKYPEVEKIKTPLEDINLNEYDRTKGIFYPVGWHEKHVETCYDIEKTTLMNGSMGLALVLKKDNKDETGIAWSFTSGSLKAKKDTEYRVKAKIKVDGSYDSTIKINPKLTFYKDQTNPGTDYGYYRKLDKSYLETLFEESKTFKTLNNVPVSCLEFGTTAATFENDFGGQKWLDDIIDIFDSNNISWSFWAYRNQAMGLYFADENVSELPESKNQKIYDYFNSSIETREWQPNTNYSQGTSVLFANESYEALKDHNSGSGSWIPPVAVSLWSKFDSHPYEYSKWMFYGSYKIGDFVSFNNSIYRCKQTHTVYSESWTPENSPALWHLVE